VKSPFELGKTDFRKGEPSIFIIAGNVKDFPFAVESVYQNVMVMVKFPIGRPMRDIIFVYEGHDVATVGQLIQKERDWSDVP